MHVGYKEFVLNNDDLARFYQEFVDLGLKYNEYLVLADEEGKVLDVKKFKGDHYDNISKHSLKTAFFDEIKPKDVYQRMAIDSLFNDQFTAITGSAGSGKSLFSLAYLMRQIETGKLDKIVIMFNPVKTAGTKDMGFYQGSFEEKALQQSIGNMLISKFGDKSFLELYLAQGKIRLVSMADGRGMEIGDGQALYITEAQNTTAEVMGLCLSRVSDKVKVVIEGDYCTQVDDKCYTGSKNGLHAAIELFAGEDMFSCVQFKNVYRSRIADIASKLLRSDS